VEGPEGGFPLGLELGDICFEEAHEIERRRKVRLAEIAGDDGGYVGEDDSPFSASNMRNAQKIKMKVSGKQRFDIQNIGAGTRCMSCGLLHFCWAPKCAGCGGPIDYNLGRQG
jgi:hypothetical protein